MGGDQACAVKAGGSVVCAKAKAENRSCTSEAVPGLSGVVELALGDGFGCARLTDGMVQCRGKNDEGQLGDGTVATRERPARVEL